MSVAVRSLQPGHVSNVADAMFCENPQQTALISDVRFETGQAVRIGITENSLDPLWTDAATADYDLAVGVGQQPLRGFSSDTSEAPRNQNPLRF